MTARQNIVAKIRRSLGASAGDATRQAIVADRLADAPKGSIPARGQVADKLAVFTAQAEAVSATVVRVKSADEVPAALADYLKGLNLAPRLRHGTDTRLENLPWDKAPNLDVSVGRSDGHDEVGLSHALGGVAETGTLYLTSGPDNPTTLNFLPENHIVVVDAADIAGDYETVWQKIRDKYGKGVMPRTVNMITGPSRSGDIEQTILLGAHGPRRLHIVVVG